MVQNEAREALEKIEAKKPKNGSSQTARQQQKAF
jgi:hypothetical protein